jgi:peptidoglycan/LPS O-acetylase OafA/YrhL
MRSSETTRTIPIPLRHASASFPPPTPLPSAPRRFASLDGIRAVAIAIVIVNHAAMAGRFSPTVTSVLQNPLVGLQGLGVTTFFVVSGFLITSILVRELDRSGTIDLTRFLLRRSLRIFPAYFTYVAVVAALGWFGLPQASGRSFVHALTFTMNYAGPHGAWTLGHLWSMASQEQFYLLWPIVFIYAGRRGASRLALGTATLTPWLYVVYVTVWPATFAARTTPFAFDTIAIGCLLALHRDRLARQPWFNTLVDAPISAPLVFALGLLGGMIGTRPGLLTHPLLAVAVALLVERSVRRPWGGLGRLLNSRPLAYLGAASFSLYLWQQIFLRPETAAVAPFDVLAAIAVGLASYHAIERPSGALWPKLERWLADRKSAQRQPTPSIPGVWRWRATVPVPPRQRTAEQA